MTTATPSIPRPAATVVLLRPAPGPPELLLTQRPATMAFAADLHVFPGGRVDEADMDSRIVGRSAVGPAEAAAMLGGGIEPDEAIGAFVAAVRELFEETGVLLVDRGPGNPDPFGAGQLRAHRVGLLAGEVTLADIAEDLDLRLRTDLLAPIGHWTTPPIMPLRFDTWFFAAELPDGLEPSFETNEVVAHRWLTARAALEAMAAGEIAMWVPTSSTIQQLEHIGDVAVIRRQIMPGPAAAPRVIAERPDLRRIVQSGAGAVPGQSVNGYLVGRRELIVVDPGDPSDVAARATLAAAEQSGGRIVAVALTHVDPDHAAGAQGLALRLDVPVFAGPGAGGPLPYPVRALADGEVLPAGDVELIALATPGPRPDHLAYAIAGNAIGGDLIVGDLVGPRADRSVLGPADETAWRASLDRLAGRRPGRLYPGHGEPRAAAAALSGGATPPGSGSG